MGPKCPDIKITPCIFIDELPDIIFAFYRNIFHILPGFSASKSLRDAKARREADMFLVEGVRAVTQIAASHPESIVEVLVEEKKKPPAGLKYPVRFISPSQFRAISTSTTSLRPSRGCQDSGGAYSLCFRPTRACACSRLKTCRTPATWARLCAAPRRSIFPAWCSATNAPTHSGPRRLGVAGSLLSLWVRRTREFHAGLRELAGRGFRCIAADVRGTEPLRSGDSSRVVLIMGNEGSGVSAEGLACSHSVMRIPINTAKAESLNVAASGAVCMYALAGLRG